MHIGLAAIPFGKRRETVQYQMAQGIVTYEKPRRLLTSNEQLAVDGLAANGISLVVKLEDPAAPANIDLEIDGNLWEVKNVTNISSISNQVKRARLKWMKLEIETPMRAVFTTIGATIHFDRICDALLNRRREGEAFLVLSEENTLRKL